MKRGFIMNREVWNNKLETLEKAETLEEILIASWGLFKCKFSSYQEQVEAISVVDKKKEEFYQKELEKKRDIVYTELLTEFINDASSNNIVKKVGKETNLEWWEIKDIILSKKNPNKIDKALANYILKKYPQSDIEERNASYRLQEAKVKVNMAEQTTCRSFSEFSKLYNRVPRYEIEVAYDLIKRNDKKLYESLKFPLFKKKTAKKQSNTVKNDGDQERIEESVNPVKMALTKNDFTQFNQKELNTFCHQNSIPIVLVKKYVGKLKDKKDSFFNLDYDSQINEILAYKETELAKAQPIINDLLAVSCGDKETIDYYYFYKNGFFQNYLAKLLSSSQLHSASYMFKKYVTEHTSSFTCFVDNEIFNYSKNTQMFLESELISYEPNEFLTVINNLKDENLPLARGLVVQKLKEMKSEKNDAKIIVKKNNI